LSGCSTPAASASGAKDPWIPERWDEETDLVIAGYGGAGVAAAITALDAGIPAIVLEKSPIIDGGNFGCSAGSIHTCILVDDPDEMKQKVLRCSFDATPNVEAINAMVDHMQDTYPWLIDHGLKLLRNEQRSTVTRAAGGRFNLDIGTDKTGSGVHLFAALDKIAQDGGIDLRLSTPITGLIQNPISKEILGAVAKKPDGTEINIKARKGVVICTGGYENSREMQYWYNHPGIFQYPWGTPYNTGDGLNLCSTAGAGMWHLTSCEYGNFGLLPATKEAGTAVCLQFYGLDPFNYVIVNRQGKRFMDDASSLAHNNGHKAILDMDRENVTYTNIPFFLIFDSVVFNAGPLYYENALTGSGPYTYVSVHKTFDWGSDNSQALQKGWILSADSIRDLAALIKTEDPATGDPVTVDVDALEETIAAYNEYATAGVDPQFNRPANRMAPVSTPPYYAIELCLSSINVQGGPWHNGSNQTLDTKGEIIPRLYNCGECGSLNCLEYIIGNVSEALTSGRVAVQHAGDLDAWDAV
jgi:succinate dehydrogenase/fumarate reductase flavoprotein subunit